MPNDPFYSSGGWRAARAGVLRARPSCETPRCGRASEHVDHRVARRRGGAALDPANLVALCHSCHSRKTVRADGGFGHKPRAVQPGAGLDGRPSDAAHPWNRGVAR